MNEFTPLTRLAVRRPAEAWVDDARIERDWRALNFTTAPALASAEVEFAQFMALFAGVDVVHLDADDALTLDALYVRDAVVMTPRGAILCRMGKEARRGEPAVNGRGLAAAGVEILGRIEPPGTLEGGDVVWFDAQTVAVARGYRTNDEGIAQLRRLLGPSVTVIVVPLPHFRGPSDVFHLMSILSPVDRDLAVVHSPLMPVPFREWLLARGMTFVEVPAGELDSQGTNVLAVAPRRVVMLDGNPITHARLVDAGVDVRIYAGTEISVKGGGGPTCLTCPLSRG